MSEYLPKYYAYPEQKVMINNNTKREISFFEKLGKIAMNPREAFGLLVNYCGSKLEATAIFILYTLTKFAIIAIAIYRMSFSFSYYPFIPVISSPIVFVIFSVVFFVLGIFSWLISGVITHILAKNLFKGVGNLSETLLLYRYIAIANVIPIVGGLAVIVYPSAETLNLLILSYLIYILWKALLTTIAVEETYGIDEMGAFLSGVAGPLLFGLIFIA